MFHIISLFTLFDMLIYVYFWIRLNLYLYYWISRQKSQKSDETHKCLWSHTYTCVWTGYQIYNCHLNTLIRILNKKKKLNRYQAINHNKITPQHYTGKPQHAHTKLQTWQILLKEDQNTESEITRKELH